MRVRIKIVEDAPVELPGQTPFEVEMLRRIPGPDRPDYWLGKPERSLQWNKDGGQRAVRHVLLAAKLAGMHFGPGMRNLPVGIAYVTDESLLQDQVVDFSKCAYVATGLADDLDSSPVKVIVAHAKDAAEGMVQALKWFLCRLRSKRR